uniref:Uncharacterized protein n=1 Tax=Heterorhabditis bacteriophora TaxID=37862 RepID=A0A1I7WC07_HETBA
MQETIHLYSRTLSSTSSESSGSCEVWLEESLWRYRPSPFYFSYLVIPDNLFHVFSRLRYDTALKGVSTIGGSDRRPLRWCALIQLLIHKDRDNFVHFRSIRHSGARLLRELIGIQVSFDPEGSDWKTFERRIYAVFYVYISLSLTANTKPA